MDEPLLQFFEYSDLPADRQVISQPFAALAHQIASVLPRNPERTTAIRRILEARDCAIRAMRWRDESSDRLTATNSASLATHLG